MSWSSSALALLINVFLVIAVSIRACDLVKTSIDFQISGDGFHRTVKVAANFSSTTRFTNCRVSYLFQIPDGAYVDVDELTRKIPLNGGELRLGILGFRQHCFAASRFDVEQPAGSAKIAQLQPILFHSVQVQRKVFVFDDVLEYPLYLRYHSATSPKDDASNVVEFNAPRMFLRCESNETLLADHVCRRRVEKIPCECILQGAKCSAISLNVAAKKINLIVPVGNEEHLQIVSISTLCAISMSVLYLLFNLTNS